MHLADAGEAVMRLIEQRKELPTDLPLLVGESETVGYDKIQRTVGRLLRAEDWETQKIPKTQR